MTSASRHREEPLAGVRAVVVNGDARLTPHLGEWLGDMGIRATFARSYREALQIVEGPGSHLALVDVDLGEEAGALELARSAGSVWGAAVVLICAGAQAKAVAAIAAVEPCGVLYKPFHRQQFQVTLRLALQRRTGPAQKPQSADVLLSCFRPREREIARLLLEHHRVPAIARGLAISPHTVRNHLKNAFKRLGVHSQEELLERLHYARK